MNASERIRLACFMKSMLRLVPLPALREAARYPDISLALDPDDKLASELGDILIPFDGLAPPGVPGPRRRRP